MGVGINAKKGDFCVVDASLSTVRYWTDVSLNTYAVVLEGCIRQYIRHCIEGMKVTVQLLCVGV